MTDEWYRSDAWDETAKSDFEKRIARSRTWTRAQYLRTKGMMIAAAGHVEDGIRLIERAIALPDGREFLRNGARESLADLLLRVERSAEAATLYRYIVANPAPGWGTSNAVDLKLIEILLEDWNATAESEVLSLAEKRIAKDDPLRLNSDEFRFAVCMVRVCELRGERAAGREWALAAIELASAGPVLPHKPYFAVVETDEVTLEWLHDRSS